MANLTDEDFQEISLDIDLDDIADLPGFKTFPPGAYLVALATGIEQKDMTDAKGVKHNTLSVNMSLVDILEMDEKNLDKTNGEEAPIVGDITSQMWSLDHPIGVGAMKMFMAPIAKSLGLRSPREVIAASKGMKLMVILGRSWKKDKDRWFQSIKKIEVI